MVKVVFYDLESPSGLKRAEKKINAHIARVLTPATTVKLFQSNGEVVYSIKGLPLAGGRAVLNTLEKLVREELGYRRGRPAGEPTHQVKMRVGQRVYRALLKAARKKGVTISRLAGEIVDKHLA